MEFTKQTAIDLIEKLNFSGRSRLPMYLQTEAAECGLACVAMVASFWGYEIDLLSLRRKFPVSLKGSRLSDLIELARRMELVSRALKLELEDLPLLKTPCILHWNLDHFVVLKQVKGDKVIIHDPAVGVMKYDMKEVSKHFTGIALELTPTTNFAKRKENTKLSLMELWRSVKGLKMALAQILLLSAALEIFAVVSPLFTQFITDQIILTADFPLLHVMSIGFALLMFIQCATEYARSWIVMYMGNTLNVQLTSNLFHHMLRLPIDFFEKRHMGDIVSKFGSIGAIQSKISTDFIEGILDGVMVIVTLIVMLLYSWKLSLVVFAALASYILVRVIFYPTFKLKNQEAIIVSAKESSVFMESVRAVLPLKVFSKESQRESVWQNCYTDNLNLGIEVSKLGLIYRTINHVLFGAENIIIMLLGAGMVMRNQGMSIGMLMAYLSYRGQFVGKAQAMVDKVIEYKMISIHLERVADIALSPTESMVMYGDKPEPKMLDQSKELKGSIRVENLGFRYSEQDPYVFRNLNFEINAGESVAIVGRSGCGKTTLLKILMRLFKPSHGHIYIDNIDVEKLSLHDYRHQIAAVMQDDLLLSGSIADNIAFFDAEMDIERVRECAKLASIDEDISAMPMGYDSLVGDMGTTLSGGQKQRILLARALYARPRILFLDEATSHLDALNEQKINEHIKNLGITRVIVAHRKETVAIAERVIDLEAIITKERQFEFLQMVQQYQMAMAEGKGQEQFPPEFLQAMQALSASGMLSQEQGGSASNMDQDVVGGLS